MADVKHVDSAELQALLSQNGVLVVDFYADWCMPCKMMAPTVEELAAAYDGRLTVAKLNVDEAPDMAARYGVQSIPTILVLKDGAVQDTMIGVQPYEALTASIEKLL